MMRRTRGSDFRSTLATIEGTLVAQGYIRDIQEPHVHPFLRVSVDSLSPVEVLLCLDRSTHLSPSTLWMSALTRYQSAGSERPVLAALSRMTAGEDATAAGR
ncbi:hypothetical protein XENOCAPTIV_014070 [Xenoophorus captivus]|uniref:Uncharacterized protein n=1 Tax=Xenoophorus captivus TaxID=1517983 RepID=A0ABV0Q528_9TELE